MARIVSHSLDILALRSSWAQPLVKRSSLTRPSFGCLAHESWSTRRVAVPEQITSLTLCSSVAPVCPGTTRTRTATGTPVTPA